MNFSAHGSYSIEKQENILFVSAKGPFNEKFVEQYDQDLKTSASQFNEQPWASLVTYYGNGIFTPDAEQELMKVINYRKRHGMIANASVIKDSIHTDLQHMQLSRIYSKVKLPFHVFSDTTSAKEWLNDFIESNNKKP